MHIGFYRKKVNKRTSYTSDNVKQLSYTPKIKITQECQKYIPREAFFGDL